MVWFHGGGFTALTSNTKPFNNPKAVASKGVVQVSVNHRLGPFGYIAHPGLSAESGYNGSGNYGQMDLIAALERGDAVPLPRFNKGADDRLPADQWERAPAGTRLLLLEGWCVGARPQPEEALAAPVNALERQEDADGRWRRFVNAALADLLRDKVHALAIKARAPGEA